LHVGSDPSSVCIEEELIKVGGGFAITPESTNSDTITVVESGIVVTVAVILQIKHSWMGDVYARLESPLGTEVPIVQYVGIETPPGPGAGDGAWFGFIGVIPALDLYGNYLFQDGGRNMLEAVETVDDLFQEMIPDDIPYSASGPYISGVPPTQPNVSLNDGFGGESITGGWKLTITDYSADDEGDLLDWTLILGICS
jgi:hypothetical protein